MAATKKARSTGTRTSSKAVKAVETREISEAVESTKAHTVSTVPTCGEITCNLIFQYMGREISQAGMLSAIKDGWTAEGKALADLKKVDLYVKPEDSAVYYVLNGNEEGKLPF